MTTWEPQDPDYVHRDHRELRREAKMDKIDRLEELLRAAKVGIQDSGHDMANCDGPKECYLCQVEVDIDQYFEN